MVDFGGVVDETAVDVALLDVGVEGIVKIAQRGMADLGCEPVPVRGRIQEVALEIDSGAQAKA